MTRKRFPAWLIFAALMVAMPVDAGVFGDGDPLNGPEDDRKGISVGGHAPPAGDWYRGTGTLVCDGAVRGSATLLDVSAMAPDLDGVVLATAAHVLYDLENMQPWDDCRFAFMGLLELPGYSAPLIPGYQLLGSFRPDARPSDPRHGSGDWAFFWLGPVWEPPSPWFAFPPGRLPGNPGLERMQGSGQHFEPGSLGLVAWDRSRDEVSVISGCQAIHSGIDDIGGGAWPGQLLDDCDSDLGASGGGVIVKEGGQSRLLAIRGGSHWDPFLWSYADFPDGPPAGSRWDPNSFTNYARTLDEAILKNLDQWLNLLP